MKPLLSIVVPTKDRYKYLKSLIELIGSFNTNSIELIIQDNTVDNEEILTFIKKDNSFLKYFHNSEQISISKNSDLAILNSSGEYICFLGDDDGVTRFIIDAVNWMKENDVDVLVPSEISYFWPDFVNSITGDISGTLSFKPFSKTFKNLSPLDSLNNIIDLGFINRGELPLVYHGIVKREVLQKIFNIGGTFFPGASPDIANGVALSLLASSYLRMDFPLIISGASRSHGAGIRNLKKKVADLDDLVFLPQGTKKNWEKEIPKVWTGETIWADSAIKALRYMNRLDLIEKVNFEHLLAWFTCMNPTLWRLSLNLSTNKVFHIVRVIFLFSKRILMAIKRKITIKLFNYNDGQIIYKDIINIKDAELKLFSLYPDFLVNKKV